MAKKENTRTSRPSIKDRFGPMASRPQRAVGIAVQLTPAETIELDRMAQNFHFMDRMTFLRVVAREVIRVGEQGTLDVNKLRERIGKEIEQWKGQFADS